MNYPAFWPSFVLVAMLLPGCRSTRSHAPAETPQEMPLPTRHVVPLAPGTARVSGLVVRREEQADRYLCTLRILEIHGYGPATPHMAVGNEVTAAVPKALFQAEGAPGDAAGVFAEGDRILVDLGSAQAGLETPSAAPTWIVLQAPEPAE